jgi:hypothetical protein
VRPHRLARAQGERNAGPAGIVDLDGHGRVGLGVAVGIDAGLVDVRRDAPLTDRAFGVTAADGDLGDWNGLVFESP